MSDGIHTSAASQRLYFLDWVRVFAFAFLIFYHTAMMFVDWSFHIESGYNSVLLKSIMLLTSTWRLDILFIVSGVAMSYMITKMSLKSFTWQRVIKLYLPLLFAVVVVVAPQSYYEAIQKGVFEGSFWQFWSTFYFTFTWDERMEAPFPTYNHMWYVLYLFHYTLVLLPLMKFINSTTGKAFLATIELWLSKKRRIIYIPIVIYLSIYLLFNDHKITHAFHNDWYGHSLFLFAVIMGLVFVRMPLIWQSFEEHRYRTLALGLASYGVLLLIYNLPAEDFIVEKGLAWDLIRLIVKWSWIALIIGFARRHLNFGNRALRYCNQAVYPFFILHQTIIIVFGYYVIGWKLPGVMAFLVISCGTFIICALLYELVIKQAALLRFLFGMKSKQITQTTS